MYIYFLFICLFIFEISFVDLYDFLKFVYYTFFKFTLVYSFNFCVVSLNLGHILFRIIPLFYVLKRPCWIALSKWI